jgi:hypothetical protein
MHTDTFRHVIPPIGRATSVRIRYDATGFGERFSALVNTPTQSHSVSGADWLLERVRVKDSTTGVVTEFEHGGWLSENTTSVFLQARSCAPSFPYEITVITGSDLGAGTDSRVFCTLFGNVCVGSSGEFPLTTSAEHSDAFEAGATDTFEYISPRSLGRIRSISMRHDASGMGSDWQLDRVRVKDVTSGEVTEFECGSWLTKDKCSVVLSAHTQSVQSEIGILYEISVDTGSDPGSGTDSKVYIVLNGEDGGHSGELALAKSAQHSDPFETGNTDTFRHVLPRSLGRVDFVRIRHDATGAGSDWKLERVRVRDMSTGVTIEFDHGDWLTNEKKEVLLPACSGKPVFPYEITVVTGKDRGAGTDSKVFCALHGESLGRSCELALASSLSHPDPFETGNSDIFRHLFPRSLGRIASICVRFDSTGFGADWLLDRVCVKDMTSGDVFEFLHGDWLTRDKKQVLIEALPQPSVADVSNSAFPSEVRLPPTLTLPGTVPDSSGAESIEAMDAVVASKSEGAVAEEAASAQRERFKRAANMLTRLGISRKAVQSGQSASS